MLWVWPYKAKKKKKKKKEKPWGGLMSERSKFNGLFWKTRKALPLLLYFASAFPSSIPNLIIRSATFWGKNNSEAKDIFIGDL